MKTWTPKDIQCGEIVARPTNCPIEGYFLKYCYKIAWAIGRGSSDRYHLVAVTDGMIVGEKSAQELCDYLNEKDYNVLTPAQYDEVCKLVRNQCTRVENIANLYKYKFKLLDNTVIIDCLDFDIKDGYGYQRALDKLRKDGFANPVLRELVLLEIIPKETVG